MISSYTQINKASNALWTVAEVIRKSPLKKKKKNNYFLDIIAESTFGELVDLLNSDKVCPIEAACMLEDINLRRKCTFSFYILVFSILVFIF